MWYNEITVKGTTPRIKGVVKMINHKWEYELVILTTGDVYKYLTFSMLMTGLGQTLTWDEFKKLESDSILQLELLNFESGAIDEFEYADVLIKRIRTLL